MPKGEGPGEVFEVYLEFVESGKRLNEYGVKHHAEEGDRCAWTEVWVECEPSATFRIVVEDLTDTVRPESAPLQCKVLIDGRRAGKWPFLHHKKCVKNDVAMERDGKVAHYPLKFASIDTVDDPTLADLDAEKASLIGSIKVELTCGRIERLAQPYQPIVFEKLGSVWEGHAKMGMTVGAGAEAARNLQRTPGWRSISTEKSLYDFQINYCTRAVLAVKFPGKFTSDLPEPRPSATISRQSVATPRKRLRSPSVSSSSTSSSSSSSSSSASSALSLPLEEFAPAAMMAMMMKMMADKQAAAKKARQEKKAKKAKKKEEKLAKKQKKREARREERDGDPAKAMVDLTGDTDEEEDVKPSLPAAGVITRAAARASNGSVR